MSLWRLIRRSLTFYHRTNIAILLAVAVGTAILTGALAVGDSVRYSLRLSAQARLGRTELTLIQRNRFFRAALANELALELDADVAPVLTVRGMVSDDSGAKRVNRVEVLGVNERFFGIGPGGNPFNEDHWEGIVLSALLAQKLAVRVGDEVLVRVDKPNSMPLDMPLAPDSDRTLAFRLTVKAVAGDSAFGRFNLQAHQVPPMNVFVPLTWLQDKLGQIERANMLLVSGGAGGKVNVAKTDAAIKKCWQLADVGTELRRLERQDVLELRSNRIFIEEALTIAAMKAGYDSMGILSYFVNEIRLVDRATPYSMVSAMATGAGRGGIMPADMHDDEVVINQWLAEDLGAKVGDLLELKYYVLGPMRKLYEKQSSFKVRDIVPMQGAALDPELMPDFPGLADVENCRDWKPGIPIKLDRIRPRDKEYWDKYRGTPKAFVTLRAGQIMWANRYGNVTAMRYEWKQGVEQQISRGILDAVDPTSMGLFFRDVRGPGAGSEQATDFGQLFLGLSMFIIAAAVILTGLVFVFGIESRSEQVGTLLALGFTARLVRRVFFAEGWVLALFGTVGGILGGLFYTLLMIWGLATIWRGAVGGAEIAFHFELVTLLVGALGGLFVSGFAMWVTLRRQIRRPARELLSGTGQWEYFMAGGGRKSKVGSLIAVVAGTAAIVVLLFAGAGKNSQAVSGAFFGAGALLLISVLGANYRLLGIVASGWNKPMVSLSGLAMRNAGRRTGRSLAVIGLLACGVFLVVAVGANRHDPMMGAERSDSGTGGFALFGESAIAVVQDLNSRAGREAMGLGELPPQVEVIHLRVYDGDDASCLNLNRVQRPRLLGVRSDELQRRGAFGFIAAEDGKDRQQMWDLLDRYLGENVIPAIGDYPTVFWALGKRLGDEIEYVDEKGKSFKVRIVAMLKSSILQGSLIISEDRFISRFPSEDGYRAFLVDAPQEQIQSVQDKLIFGLRDFGAEITPAKERLAQFSLVENTYLSIFTMLGGLGLVLGSVGLGLVVLRNVLERRGELAMLWAVGFGKNAVKSMVIREHAGLMVAGLVCGVAAALVAVVPALRWPGGNIPYISIMLISLAIGVSGAVWVWIAATFAVRGGMLDALRSE